MFALGFASRFDRSLARSFARKRVLTLARSR